MSINSRMAVARASIATKVLEGQLRKNFDPSQPRNEDGEWASSGGSSSPKHSGSKESKTVVEHVRNARGWLSTTRVGVAANKVAPHAKDALASVAAAIITSPTNSDMYYDVVKTNILHLADGMKVSKEQARDHLVEVMTQLKKARQDILGKADKPVDPVIEALDAIIAALKKVKFDQPSKPKPKE